MQSTSQRSFRSTLIALAGLATVGALTGCSAILGAPTVLPHSSSPPTPTGTASAPWDDPSVPTAVIEFERDGETHTVSGEIPDGLRSCGENGAVIVSSKSPDPGIGVSFTLDEKSPTHAGVWIVGEEYAVQVLAQGEILASPTDDGGTNYSSVGATGRVSALPSEPDKKAIGEYDFTGVEQHEGTASFTVNCPAPE